MPPAPLRFDGLAAVTDLMDPRSRHPTRRRLAPGAGGGEPDARCSVLLVSAGDTEFRAFKLDVLRIEGGAIAEITTFGYALFSEFGLADVLAQ